MTKTEITGAVARLKSLRPDQAAQAAYADAAHLLGHTESAETACGSYAEVWILALALYFSAVTAHSQHLAFAVLQALIEDRYQKLLANDPDEAIFTSLLKYPEPLCDYLRALSLLPRDVVTESMRRVRHALANATD